METKSMSAAQSVGSDKYGYGEKPTVEQEKDRKSEPGVKGMVS